MSVTVQRWAWIESGGRIFKKLTNNDKITLPKWLTLNQSPSVMNTPTPSVVLLAVGFWVIDVPSIQKNGPIECVLNGSWTEAGDDWLKHAAWMWVRQNSEAKRPVGNGTLGEIFFILQWEGDSTIRQEKHAWVRRFQYDSCAVMTRKEQRLDNFRTRLIFLLGCCRSPFVNRYHLPSRSLQ